MLATTASQVRSIAGLLVLVGIAGCGNAPQDTASPAAASSSAASSSGSSFSAATPTSTSSSAGSSAAGGIPPGTTESPLPSPSRAITQPEAPDPPQTEPVFRPDDDRPRHDDKALERVGIRKYVSRRLLLYTDIEEREAVRLPPLVDALYEKLVDYFGELPPARDGSDWQITGYVMRDLERFRAAGLIPSRLPAFNHGLNHRIRFWMHEQGYDDYREHLLLHEATHCFMTTLPVRRAPPWYMEGMAEHFATHRTLPEGTVEFAVIPESPDEMQGFDRITLIRKEVDAGRAQTFEGVRAIGGAAFLEPVPYAWSWAACQFLDSQPDYHDRFRELGDVRLRSRFRQEFDARFADDSDLVRLRWQFFVRTLCYGYDTKRAALVIDAAGANLLDAADVTVRADAGWQSMRLRLKQGATYELIADGQVTLADSPQPWISDANGITIEYAGGKPVGRLLAAVVGDDLRDPAAAHTLFDPIDVGGRAVLKAPTDGTLYLRINDAWNRLADNRGELSVHVRRIDD